MLSEKTTFCFWRSNLEHRVKIKMKRLFFYKNSQKRRILDEENT